MFNTPGSMWNMQESRVFNYGRFPSTQIMCKKTEGITGQPYNMAISEFEIKRCEKHVGEYIAKHRPPVHIRNEVDLSYRIDDQSIVIFEIRSLFNKVDEKIESMVAKTTYIKKTRLLH